MKYHNLKYPNLEENSMILDKSFQVEYQSNRKKPLQIGKHNYLHEWTNQAKRIVNKINSKQYPDEIDLKELTTIYNAANKYNYQGWSQSDINRVSSILIRYGLFNLNATKQRIIIEPFEGDIEWLFCVYGIKSKNTYRIG